MRLVLVIISLVGLIGCSAGTSTPEATPSAPEPPAFDVALVKTNYTAECGAPIIVDDLFCQQVEISGMYAEGEILYVPTGLNPAATDRADVICAQVARAHFDGDSGADLGYRFVGVLDMNGGNAAAFTVD